MTEMSYLVVKTQLAEGGDVFRPFNHDHELLLDRLTDVAYIGQFLLIDTHCVHCHTHLHTGVSWSGTPLINPTVSDNRKSRRSGNNHDRDLWKSRNSRQHHDISSQNRTWTRSPNSQHLALLFMPYYIIE